MAYSGKYISPQELMLDESLSVEDKIEMLEQWRDDKEALSRASDDGMQGSARPGLLNEITNALISLQERSPRQ
ncbi:MAG: hypothetical protein ABI240_06025 [Sphingomonas sp.]